MHQVLAVDWTSMIPQANIPALICTPKTVLYIVTAM